MDSTPKMLAPEEVDPVRRAQLIIAKLQADRDSALLQQAKNYRAMLDNAAANAFGGVAAQQVKPLDQLELARMLAGMKTPTRPQPTGNPLLDKVLDLQRRKMTLKQIMDVVVVVLGEEAVLELIDRLEVAGVTDEAMREPEPQRQESMTTDSLEALRRLQGQLAQAPIGTLGGMGAGQAGLAALGAINYPSPFAQVSNITPPPSPTSITGVVKKITEWWTPVVSALALFLCCAGVASATTVDLWMLQGVSGADPLCAQGSNLRLCVTTGFTDPVTAVIEMNDGFSDVAKLRPDGTLAIVYDGYVDDLRCFSDAPSTCSGTGGPFNTQRYIDVPIHTQPIDVHRVNNHPENGEAAIRVITKATFYVNDVDPESCRVLSSLGTIQHSLFLYMVPSYDFGGIIGVRQNVVIYEAVSGYMHSDDWPRRGVRLERYYADQVLGIVRQEGFEDATCMSGGACLEQYTTPAPGTTTFNAAVGRFARLPLAAPCGVR